MDKQFKIGDPVAFEHLGNETKGTILELMGDGRIRIKDTRGYIYRYAAGNVSHDGDPIVKNPKVPEPAAATKQEIKPNNTKSTTMEPKEVAVKATKAPKAAPAAGTANAETIAKIAGLTCKKHQRIFLLLDAGCSKEETMQHAKCNAGEVSNVRKMYGDNEKRVAEAKALVA